MLSWCIQNKIEDGEPCCHYDQLNIFPCFFHINKMGGCVNILNVIQALFNFILRHSAALIRWIWFVMFTYFIFESVTGNFSDNLRHDIWLNFLWLVLLVRLDCKQVRILYQLRLLMLKIYLLGCLILLTWIFFFLFLKHILL